MRNLWENIENNGNQAGRKAGFLLCYNRSMRTGVATIPLDYGRCPRWLFERMTKLARGITFAIIEEYGPEEFLKRMSDPVWFQSFGCVLGFDWNSSGLATTTMGALKEAIKGIESKIGLFICGGKGKTSKKTPMQVQEWGEFLGFSIDKIDELVYTSKAAAKVDSAALQDGFQIYHHNLLFSKSGEWGVLQQGMNTNLQKARRYHWLSENVKDFVEEPHSGIASDIRVKPLNLTAKESRNNKKVSTELAAEEPKTIIRDLELLQTTKTKNLTIMELYDKEFHWHPVVNEKFDLKRFKKIIEKIHFLKPKNFEQLLMTQGVGPRTIRALSLVSEIIYGAKPSYEDPARYTFAYGGKDGTPYPVDRGTYDKTLEIIEKGIQKSQISIKEKTEAQVRLNKRF